MSESQDNLDRVPVQGKYTFTEAPDGFTVHGVERAPVRVALYPTYLEIAGTNSVDGTDYMKRLGFYEYYELSHTVADCLMANWERPERHDGHGRWPGARQWAVNQTARAIGRRVHARWKGLLTEVDSSVLAVHRAMFAATMKTGDLAMSEELYQHPHIVSDIINYRAAAIAAATATLLAQRRERSRIQNSPEAHEIRTQLIELEARAKTCGLRLPAPSGIGTYFYVDPDALLDATPHPLTAMYNWRGLFSCTGEPYRSLNRTLMNLPGGIPHKLLANLACWRLERPYTERLELLTLLLYSNRVDRNNWSGETLLPRLGSNDYVFEHATRPQITEAMCRVAAHTRNELSTRRTRHIGFLVNFLADFPDVHTGNIVGLADKAICWHRDRQEAAIERQLTNLGGNTKTAVPPVLPDIPGVTFLDTVEAVCREGAEMGHCVASYARHAVDGRCYLFHIEHNGDQATVEVCPRTGQVLQAHGPRNRQNGAARWGKRVLARWGRQAVSLGPP